METGPIQRNRYRVSFYKNHVLEYQFGALGVNHRDAMEVAKKYLREVKGVDWSEFDHVSEEKPMSVRLDRSVGIEVHDLLKE